MKKKLVVAAFSIVLLSWPKITAAQCLTFGGRASVVQVNATGTVPVVLSDTGYLDSTGGDKQASLLSTSVPGVVTAEVMHARAVGEGYGSSSEASVANLNLTVAGNTISAAFLLARASATCGALGATVSGRSQIAGLAANGQNIVVSGSPNQTVSLPGGVTIIINEQTSSVQGQNGSISVNALHVAAPGAADAVVASSFLVIGGGGGGGGGCQDVVTGGGWITTNNTTGAKGNFGVAGGIGQTQYRGHLEYIDHGTGMNVHGTGVTDYYVLTGTVRRIQGTAEINHQSGFTYTVDVADNGEPGTNDTFVITLSNGYSASGTVSGGNIQLHNDCP